MPAPRARMRALAPDPGRTHRNVVWRKVAGLAALETSILLGWRAYDYYQPKILGALGLLEFGGMLLVVQGLVALVTQPLAGALSDRLLARRGSRFLVIVIGVTLAGLIFVASALLLRLPPSPMLRVVVPAMTTLWVASMMSFRPPAISLLSDYAEHEKLPLAVALLTIANGVVGALGSYLNQVIAWMGTSATFAIGALVLWAGAMVLRLVAPDDPAPLAHADPGPASWRQLGRVFGVGLGVGFAINLLLDAAPVLSPRLPGIGAEGFRAAVLLLSALLSLPAASLATRSGADWSLLAGLGALTATLEAALVGVGAPGWLWVVTLGLGLAAVLNSAIPFALTAVPAAHAGLAAGVLFAGRTLSALAYAALGHDRGAFCLVAATLLVVVCVGHPRPAPAR